MPIAPGAQPAVPAIVWSLDSATLNSRAVARAPRGEMSSRSDLDLCNDLRQKLAECLSPGAVDIEKAEALLAPERMRPGVRFLLARGARFLENKIANAAASLPPQDPKRARIESLGPQITGKDAAQPERLKSLKANLDRFSSSKPIDGDGLIRTIEASRSADLAALDGGDIARWRSLCRAAVEKGKLSAHRLWRIEGSLDNGFDAAFEAHRLRHNLVHGTKESVPEMLEGMSSGEAVVAVDEYQSLFGENPLRAAAERFGVSEAERLARRLYGDHVLALVKEFVAAQAAGQKSDWLTARSHMSKALTLFAVVEDRRGSSQQSEEECFSGIANVYEALLGRTSAGTKALSRLRNNKDIESLKHNERAATTLLDGVINILDGRRKTVTSHPATMPWSQTDFESATWRKP